ncbi:NAD-dependent epimerase/dehydratase [Isosphaera pallida ATCC 43644]|uniref:GDP-L-fucose synthase n=1 Tax=Isosphaera pallida (strain ATCC 43644 / DSM 9630 / IS1B) TaxID=575540 RepID=E8R300_ISOPI|nr:NAD-dependent epimerase/dehydratase family protein [Isosphaera pallida]ADV61504.1 NAD-dependent epimerase/dehydratase [Isosphaera pallida ATCC 43644]
MATQAIWSGRRVTVTGGSGFLGGHLVKRLHTLGAKVFVPRSASYNLVRLEDCLRCLLEHPCDLLIHAAAFYGGIGINQTHPGSIYYTNLVMGANIMEAARLAKVSKVVNIGTACSYPGYLEGELKEEDLWAGPCHASVVNYGLTKKMLAVQGLAYRKQYGLDSIHLILTNLYGPGDSYNPERSHVVAALIRKFVEAEMHKADSVEVWGTGQPIREFIEVGDCAEGILLAAERYDDPELPLNIGTGVGTSIRQLTELIHELSGFKGRVVWNADKPDGAAKKVLDITRMTHVLDGWTPPTSLREGLARTIAWYRAHKAQADAKW